MEIQSVYFDQETQQVTVTALVEDMVLTYPGSYYDPPEYGPALCETTFSAEDCEINIEDDDELAEFLYDAEWEIIEEWFN